MITENSNGEQINIDPRQQNILEIEYDQNEDPIEDTYTDERKSGFNPSKYKILAAIGIMAMAGYLAYWVQEPVQIKSDILSNDSIGVTSQQTVAQNTGKTTEVDLSLFGFDPINLTIAKGDTVKWTNTSSEEHVIIAAGSEGKLFESEILYSGDTFSFTFEEDDFIEYYSTYRPAQVASITVGAGVVSSSPSDTQADDFAADLISVSTVSIEEDAEPLIVPLTESDESSGETLFGAALENSDIIEISTDSTEVESVSESAQETQTSLDEMSDQEKVKLNEKTLRGVAETDKLAETGPEYLLYLAVFGTILYFNRKKTKRFRVTACR